MSAPYHIPALLHETIAGLSPRPDGIYVDCTFGGGGHSRAILDAMGTDASGQLFSMDRDIDAFTHQQQLEDSLTTRPQWHFIHGNFRYLSNFMDYYGVKQIDGLLADLGVSFHHFDEAERGFSFRFAGPLDMRMNRLGGLTAADIVNSYSEEALARILYIYGEMDRSRFIAKRICDAARQAPICTTEQLVMAVSRTAKTDSEGNIDVAPGEKKDLARLFQALRIEVNDELGALQHMLTSALQLLKPEGRIAILTYHSLEDRMVKNFLRSGNIDGKIEKDFYGNILTPFHVLEKGRTASSEEVESNPRARSAKLRVAVKKK